MVNDAHEEPQQPQPKERHEKDCGCVVTVMDNGLQQYEPCLPHALDHAGRMLMAAGAKFAKMQAARPGPRIVRAGPGDIPPQAGGRFPGFGVDGQGRVQ
jgi:hypothetical protein